MHFVGSSGFALCEWLGGLPVVVNDVNPVGSPMAAKLVHCLQAQHGQSFQNQAAAAQAGCRVASAAAPLPGDLLREISHLRKECSALRRQLRHAGRVAEQAPEADFAEALQRVSCSGLSFNMKQASGGGLLAVLADI